jgi:hypothetical protein
MSICAKPDFSTGFVRHDVGEVVEEEEEKEETTFDDTAYANFGDEISSAYRGVEPGIKT